MSSNKQTAIKKLPIFPILLGLIVLVGVVALIMARGGSEDKATGGVSQAGYVDVRGKALSELGDGSDPDVGSDAPELVGHNYQGDTVNAGGDNGPQVLVFAAHWCPHCQAEVPRIIEWLKAEPTEVGVTLISTSLNKTAPNYPPSSWLSRVGWDHPVIADDEASTAAGAYGVSSFPFFAVVDGDGKLVMRTSGELSEAQFRELLDAAQK